MTKPKLTTAEIEATKERARMAAQDKVIRAIILPKETAESFTGTWDGLKA